MDRQLALLIRALAPRRLLDLGTSNGYSTIWLADGAGAVDGSLISVEIDPSRTAQARENLQRAHWTRLWISESATPPRSCRPAPTVSGISSSWTPSAPPTPATGLTWCGFWPTSDERVTEALVPTGAGALLVVREPA